MIKSKTNRCPLSITDAQYWAENEGDFDEQTADDWDVDMSEYYGEEGDKDARDFVQIQREKRYSRLLHLLVFNYFGSVIYPVFQHLFIFI